MLTKSIVMSVLLIMPVAFAAGPAAAKSWQDERGKNEYEYKEEYKRTKHGYKYKWRDGNCKNEYKTDKHGYKEKRKCKGGAHYTGGPPPWAPAHGYRAHQRGGYQGGTQTAYVPPYDIGLGRCNRDLIGGLLCGAAGGLIGSRFGKGDGKLAAVAGGALLGFLIGGGIGRSMDQADQSCLEQSLEHAEDGQQITWNNPDSGTRYRVVPTKTTTMADGRYCREYTTTATVGGKVETVYGRACRQPDGAWQIKS